MRNAFVNTLHELARADRNVLLLTADNGAIVFDRYRAEMAAQFINCGICEATMVSVAAGLAAGGKVPFVYTIIPFLIMRAFEQVRNDVCMQKMNVKLIGIGGGLKYSTLGPTHHAIEDLAIMRALPNMTVVVPADGAETARAIRAIRDIPGPVYLRMGTNKEPAVYTAPAEFLLGKGVVLRDGGDVTLIASGAIVHDVLQAAERLAQQGVQARVVNIHTLKPLDRELILASARQTQAVLTVEEHTIIGGLGEAVAAVLLEAGLGTVRFQRLGIRDHFCHGYGPHEYMKERHGLAVEDMVKAVLRLGDRGSGSSEQGGL